MGVEYLDVKQVHDLLREDIPPSAHTAVDAAKRGAAELQSEACKEFLRMWAWSPDAHCHFPGRHKRFAVFLLLVSRRLVVGSKHDEGRSGLQRVFAAYIMPFVIDRTDRLEFIDDASENTPCSNADLDEKKLQ